MTALTKYQRLEGPGLWRPAAHEQRRDVVVALGKASLTITDARSGEVFGHWSLPALRRVNPGHRPALYVPSDEDDGEALELEDAVLIEALETIRGALAPRARGRRLRLALGAGVLLTAAALAVFWLPGALISHTAGIVPPATRAQIGRAVLDELTATRPGIHLCAEPAGRQALATLRGRVLGANHRAVVLAGLPGLEAAHLPGRLVVLGPALLERLDGPEALAGYLLAEELASAARDPLPDLLRHAGLRATLTLLTTGNLPHDRLAAWAEARLVAPPSRPDPALLVARLEALGVSPAPYALSLPEGAADLAQALADQPAAGPRGAGRLLGDGEWIVLQTICQG